MTLPDNILDKFRQEAEDFCNKVYGHDDHSDSTAYKAYLAARIKAWEEGQELRERVDNRDKTIEKLIGVLERYKIEPSEYQTPHHPNPLTS